MTSTATTRTTPAEPATGPLVLRGIVALAVAMGIGRFAFTPLLPLMLRDGSLSASTGADWAAANYLGYLAGALTATRFAGDSWRGLRLALAGVALTTLAIAGLDGAALGAGGTALRAAAGFFSAWALIFTSSACLSELARHRAAHLGAWIYTGVGLGIALAGALVWLGGRQPARCLWLELGLLAGGSVLLVGRGPRHTAAAAAAGAPWTSGGASRSPLPLLLCYGSFGFGYIVPATYLPAMARQQVADPLVFGLLWPLFGGAAALSVAATARWLAGWPRGRVWALAQGVMAVGAGLPLLSRTLWSLAACAVLVGGTFMVATLAGFQLVRERFPARATPLLAQMTVAFATGQIVGPLLVRALGAGRRGGWDALAWAHAVASLLLGLTAAWLWHEDRDASRSARGPRP